MRNNIWQGLITVLAFATIAFAQSGNFQLTNQIISPFSEINSHSEKRVGIRFSESTSLSEAEEIIYQYGLIPEELNFEIENPYGETIYGGYTVDRNLTLDNALADFKQKHEEFFQEAIKSLATDVKNEKDKSVRLGLRNLRNQFSMLLDEYRKDGLKLSSITVNESSPLNLMFNDSRFEKFEITTQREKTEAISDKSTASTWYSWQPNRGSSKVNKSITFQVFYFNNVSAFRSSDTYEHETQVYNRDFANYANYYSTNLPSGYVDTQLLDNIDNFTVGTPKASELKINTQYYTSMSLVPQSAATATVRIKGQKGYRRPSFCYSLWCVFPSATTDSLVTFTAPISNQRSW